jgi:AcrR family transcriptional regulator
MSPSTPREDRRVQRTKRSLHRAMASLVHEKPLGAIAVKEILARAAVGRSAFYAHFRDKDDLLISAIRETLRSSERRASSANATEYLLRFSRPLLDHIDRAELPRRGSGAGHAHVELHEGVRRVLVERLLADLEALSGRPSAPTTSMPSVPPSLVAEHVADTFLRVVHWWAEEGALPSAAAAERVFRELVIPCLDHVVDV